MPRMRSGARPPHQDGPERVEDPEECAAIDEATDATGAPADPSTAEGPSTPEDPSTAEEADAAEGDDTAEEAASAVADPAPRKAPRAPAKAAKNPRPAKDTGPARERAVPAGRRPVLAAAVALLVAAAVAAVWTGVSWYSAAHDDNAAFARTRDTVLAAGEQAVQNMNTLDHAHLAQGLDVWEQSTTGDLHTQLVQGRADFEKQVQQAQTVSTAKVLSAAVTDLDDRTGKADVMVALQITVQAPKAKPAVKESRLLGEMTRTSAGWKLSALGQAPMGDSASATDPGTTAAPAATAPTTAAGT